MSSENFVSGSDILDEVRALIESSQHEIRIAVAFWGKGAVQRIALNKRTDVPVEILCNASSGACNPDAMSELIGLPNVKVKNCNWLHAKVFLSTDALIAGSANVSANGLSLEGHQELKGWNEAAIVSTNGDAIDDAQRWFSAIWDNSNCEEVDDEFIGTIRPVWNARRRARPLSTSTKETDILSVLDSSPEVLTNRGIRVLRYPNENRSEGGEKATEEIRKEFDDSPPGEKISPILGATFSRADSYETKQVKDTPEEKRKALAGWPWNNWLIDTTDNATLFWFLGPQDSVQKIRQKANVVTFVVPAYGARKLPLSNGAYLTLSRKSLVELRRRADQRRRELGKAEIDIPIEELLL
ncbi:hypothetical protein FHS78_003817 [Parvibaculum indicum]|nr:phospholipase D family protein [Parvibaculum indicum]NIJ43502.1 hypothetical protein [Parvibaculum indicum]